MATILLVDDQILFRENLAEALGDHGYEVVQAQDAEEALSRCDQSRPDLFLLDIALPGASGLELMRRIQARAELRRVPAFFLTAFPREEYLEEAQGMGVGDFLVKSDISLQDLLERIERRLNPAPAGSASLRGGATTWIARDEDEPHMQLRPALRRWRPPAPRPGQIRLFQMAAIPDLAPADLEDLCRLDPGLEQIVLDATEDIPARGGPRDLHARLETLGTIHAMRLLLATTIMELAGKSIPPGGDLARLWRHAIASGLFACRLSSETCFPASTAAFLAGMCCELPSVFAILALEDEYDEIRAGAWEDGLPIQQTLAGLFETSPTHLALECLRPLELPESVWKPVVDRQSAWIPTTLWTPSPGGLLLEAASLLAMGAGQIWNPCQPVRRIRLGESRDWRDPERLREDIPMLERELALLLSRPSLSGLGRPQPLPVSRERDIRLLVDRDGFHPDPLGGCLATMGSVRRVRGLKDLSAPPLDSEAGTVRVVAAEPGSALWNKVLECPRHCLLLHTLPLPPEQRLGAHSALLLPAPLAEIERALRPTD